MPETRKYSLVKPSINTPFHIDFDWWNEHDNNSRVFLHDFLCPEHQAVFSIQESDLLIDYIDPTTAEIHRVDGIQQKLMTHCSKLEGFVSTTHSLVDNVFRIFLANGNTPLTPEELSELTGKPGVMILRLLSGSRVFMGIRPCQV